MSAKLASLLRWQPGRVQGAHLGEDALLLCLCDLQSLLSCHLFCLYVLNVGRDGRLNVLGGFLQPEQH